MVLTCILGLYLLLFFINYMRLINIFLQIIDNIKVVYFWFRFLKLTPNVCQTFWLDVLHFGKSLFTHISSNLYGYIFNCNFLKFEDCVYGRNFKKSSKVSWEYLIFRASLHCKSIVSLRRVGSNFSVSQLDGILKKKKFISSDFTT